MKYHLAMVYLQIIVYEICYVFLQLIVILKRVYSMGIHTTGRLLSSHRLLYLITIYYIIVAITVCRQITLLASRSFPDTSLCKHLSFVSCYR